MDKDTDQICAMISGLDIETSHKRTRYLKTPHKRRHKRALTHSYFEGKRWAATTHSRGRKLDKHHSSRLRPIKEESSCSPHRRMYMNMRHAGHKSVDMLAAGLSSLNLRKHHRTFDANEKTAS